MIPPLVPVPANNTSHKEDESNARSGAARQEHIPIGDEREDVFAALFSPATPRASPTLGPTTSESDVPTIGRPSAPYQHSRTYSTDSEFGAFVSVPSTEDPLAASSQSAALSDKVKTGLGPESADKEFFERFAEDAKAASEKNRKGLLDELLQHEDDPLYFLKSGAETNNASSAGPTSPSDLQYTSSSAGGAKTVGSLLGLDFGSEPVMANTHQTASSLPVADSGVSMLSYAQDVFIPPGGGMSSNQTPSRQPTPTLPHERALKQATETLLDLVPTPVKEILDPLPSDSSSSSTKRGSSSTRNVHLPQSHSSSAHRNPQSHAKYSPPLVRSPSLPSPPEVQPAQSIFTPSTLVSSAFPSKWVSSLLSRPSASSSSTTSRPTFSRSRTSSEDLLPSQKTLNAPTTFTRPTPSPVHTPHLSELFSSTHTRATTLASGSASTEIPITHGTPFASQPYIPPSGAPGFTGDRTWNTGKFEFDKDRVEKKSVRLVGRKELTAEVLTVSLANAIRPYFPALSRLPQSWQLLYSLDQHGISLRTLYAKCDSFKGGALIVIRDSNDALFGVWMGEGIHPSKGAYYGSGESFLWKVDSESNLKVYKWTGKNDYVALCESDYISFGGGDGKYGLYLDETLTDGSSARCPTFDNEPLCSPAGPRQGGNVTFECVGLEVWGVG
ncbi:TLD-domain-containing protein [Panus rudis PR-1116 ss-1]|nr:TLD-domain-containing protein [Panus rudis PR-1116 ss-1]